MLDTIDDYLPEQLRTLPGKGRISLPRNPLNCPRMNYSLRRCWTLYLNWSARATDNVYSTISFELL